MGIFPLYDDVLGIYLMPLCILFATVSFHLLALGCMRNKELYTPNALTNS